MLKWIALSIVALALIGQAQADEWVNGYRRANGTYVAGYYRSDRDGSFQNNWSTKGNTNPYTGQPGTRVTPPNSLRSNYEPWPSGPSLRGNSLRGSRSGGIQFGN